MRDETTTTVTWLEDDFTEWKVLFWWKVEKEEEEQDSSADWQDLRLAPYWFHELDVQRFHTPPQPCIVAASRYRAREQGIGAHNYRRVK
jgi:hypothetical protein